MAGAAKQRANQERELQARMRPGGSSSGGTSSKASQSVRSSASASASVAASAHSITSRRSGYDGNRDPEAPGPSAIRNPNTSRPMISDNMGKSLDLGTVGFSRISGVDAPTNLATRPAPSTLGTAIQMGLNTFDIVKFPSAKVFQYEVLVGNGAEKRGLIDKVWSSKAVRQALGSGWIFDGELPSKLSLKSDSTDIY